MLSDPLFRLRGLFRRNAVETELDDELQFHFECEVDKGVASGLTREEAMRKARLAFGGLDPVKEGCREVRGLGPLDTFLQDIRYGLRMLRKTPVFTVIAILTIAAGIAANVSIFTFMDALFLRSVPAKDPARLVRMVAPEGVSYPEYVYLRDHTRTLSSLIGHYSTAPLYVTAKGEIGEVQGAVVSSNYFTTLGVQPQFGRLFTADEDSAPDRDAVAVISYGFWQRMYGSDPNAVGKTLLINGHGFQIIGIVPQEFQGVEIGGAPNEVWIPAMMIRIGYRWCDGLKLDCPIFSLLGRLGPGESGSQAQAEMATLLRQLHPSAPASDDTLRVSVAPAIGISGDRTYFLLLTRLLATIASLLLVIVCSNLAGLLIARGKARAAELAMRRALGAGRTRMIRQLLTESLLLACAGGALGFVISLWTTRLLIRFYGVDAEGYRHAFDVRPDTAVLVYSALVTVFAGLLFGLLPAWYASRSDLNEVLKGRGERVGTDHPRSRSVLATIQVAISLAVLVGAGLLIRSTARLNAGANMDLNNVLGLRLRPGLVQYPPDKARAFKRAVIRRLRELPGVESVSLAKGVGLVWRANPGIRMAVPGESYSKASEQTTILYKPIAPDYFATLKIPLVAGRDFTGGDITGSPAVVIVNEALASRPSSGKLTLDRTILLNDKPYRIVGVVKDAQFHSVMESPEPVAYLPYWQDDTLLDARVCVRVSGTPRLALPMIRKAIASIDSNVPVTETMPLIDQVRSAYSHARVAGAVLACAGVLGLLLSAIGLYGVIAFEVTRRTREIGIRMALGAQPQEIIRPFLRQALIVIVMGSIAGGAVALATARLLAAWLFGVGSSDPATFLLATTVMFAVALLASYIPARRALRVDPMVALRYE